jgi:hypothetical protein
LADVGEGLAYSPKGDKIATGGMFDILVHDAKTGQGLNPLPRSIV